MTSMRRLAELWRVAPWPMGAAAVAAVMVSVSIWQGSPVAAGVNGMLCGVQIGMAGMRLMMERHKADLEKMGAFSVEVARQHDRVMAELTALQVVLKEMGVEVEMKSHVERTH